MQMGLNVDSRLGLDDEADEAEDKKEAGISVSGSRFHGVHPGPTARATRRWSLGGSLWADGDRSV